MILGLAFFLYILPGLIASGRKHHNKTAIWVLTIFLGWSFIGWAICLAWSFTNPPAQQIVINNGKVQP